MKLMHQTMVPRHEKSPRAWGIGAGVRVAVLAGSVLVLSAGLQGMGVAAEKPVPVLPPTDDDFPYQGEYAGVLRDVTGRPNWTGLQVVAQGKGEFFALEIPGGLPGSGGRPTQQTNLVGWRKKSQLQLAGNDRQITVELNEAIVRDGRGRELGRLRKYLRTSHSLGQKPPSGAIVLFDGADVDHLTNASVTPDRLLNVGADTRESYGDFRLHVEFRTPYMPSARGQSRGNSGIYIQGRYEVQILDSFGLEGLNNECGSLYKTHAPSTNMCLPPMAWQSYDIDFVAARFNASGEKAAPVQITVRHNGVVVQDRYEIPDKTGAGAAEGPDARPIRFQNHNDAVNFRNVWIVPGTPSGESKAPPRHVTMR